ncbi:unnamed protein product [Sphagnum jensenii]|uniref:UBR-type domain-containing protein n=1 Tax=Sphagnum jensenii TaxID=128206 RepID=A0ABP1B0W5_9BRYO
MEDGNVEEEAVVDFREYMHGLAAEELEVDLILGGDEGTECTYSQGYKNRQAIFACRTCTPDGNAGFCTACSLSCHEGHDVLELWTRRRFRCDCGNSKFGVGICRLQANKESENSCNIYNQNYKGVYCICKRPHPDPDLPEQCEMLQCCICEDWFHEHHLGLPPSLQYPKDEEGEPLYDELVCQACVPRCSFISQYPKALIPPSSVIDDVAEDPVEAVEPVTSRGYPHVTGNTENNVAGLPYLNGTKQENVTPIVAQAELSNAEISGECVVDCKLGTITEQKQTSTLHHLQKATSSCLSTLDEVAEGPKPEPVGPFFLSSGWRAKLCQCPHCLNMYEEKGVSFLLDRDDTMQEYEATGKRKREEALARSEGAESNFMQKMGHIEQIEILRGVNEMTSGLQAFLAPFGETGKTVTSADIHEFFEKLNQKRHRRI